MKEISEKEVKEIELNILKYISEICEKEKIDYFLISGSLLGAIRHNGFIPWDDDIDIALTSENYNKLKSAIIEDNSETFQLLDNSIQKDYCLPFMKLVDNRTILIENNRNNVKEYGIYIDIFEYTNTAKNEVKRRKQLNRLKKEKLKMFFYSTAKYKNKNIIKKIIFLVCSNFYHIIGSRKIIVKYYKKYYKYFNEHSNYLISNWPCYDYEHEIQKSENLEETITHQFENIEVKIPKEYDKVLTTQFGNYMELPPEEKRVSNHNFKAYWK